MNANIKKILMAQLAFLCLSSYISATFYPKLSLEEIAQTADIIFVGTAVSEYSRIAPLKTMIFTDVIFERITVIHAKESSLQKNGRNVVLTFAGGEYEGIQVEMGGRPRFQIGERYLIFAFDDGETRISPIIGGTQGLFKISQDMQTFEQYILSPGNKVLLGMSDKGLRFSRDGAAAIKGKTIVANGNPSQEFIYDVLPTPTDEKFSVRPTDLRASERGGSPVTLNQFVAHIRNTALATPLLEKKMRFGNSGVFISRDWKSGEIVEAPLVNLRSIMKSPVPIIQGAGQTDSFAPQTQLTTLGTPYGVCGYQKLPIVMEQVPSSWWEWSVNNSSMVMWNRFIDMYRYTDSDGTYAWYNGQSEFAGYVDNDSIRFNYLTSWDGSVAMVKDVSSPNCGRIYESDILWNPAYSFTTDRTLADRKDTYYLPYVDMHELGHTWGYQSGVYSDYAGNYDYDHPSIMQGQLKWERGDELHAVDAAFIRYNYQEQTAPLNIKDVGVETYYMSGGIHKAELNGASIAEVGRGQSLTVSGITVENMSLHEVSYLYIRMFLFQDAEHQYQVGEWYWPTFPSTVYAVNDFTGYVPYSVPLGEYRVRFVVTVDTNNLDDLPGNNDAFLFDCTARICDAPATPKIISYPEHACFFQDYVVSWSSVPTADFYEVERALDPDFTVERTFIYSGWDTQTTNYASTSMSVNCYYRVRGYNDYGFGPWNTGGPIRWNKPDPPQAINHTSVICAGTHTVGWPPSTGATTYELQASIYSDFRIAATIYTGPNTTFTQSGIPAGTFYLRVSASNSCGTSAWTRSGPIRAYDQARLRTPNTPDPADGASGVVLNPTLTWSAGAALGYEVYFGTSSPPPLVTSYPIRSSIYQPGNLNIMTTYYWKIVAFNECETLSGPVWSFTTTATPVVPILTTSPIVSITTSSAQCGGQVASDGGAAITEKGVCWSASANPTIANSHTHDGSGAAAFVSDLIGLNQGTTYYVRAYATNSVGTAYGNELQFRTLISTTFLIPFGSLDNGNIDIGNIGTATANLVIKILNGSGQNIKELNTTLPPKGVKKSWDLLGNIFGFGKPLTVEVTGDEFLAADNIKWASPPYDTVGAGFTCGPSSMMKGQGFVLPFSAFGQSNGYAVISNATSNTANITVRVYDQNGVLKKSASKALPSRGVMRTWEMIGSIQAIADPASLTIDSDQEIVVEAVRWELNKRGWGFAIFPGPIGGGTDFLIPFGCLENGNLNLSNMNSYAASVRLRVLNSGGAVVKEQSFSIPIKGIKRSWDIIGNIYGYGKPVTVEVSSLPVTIGRGQNVALPLTIDNIKWANPPYDTVGAGFNCGPLTLMKGKLFYFPYSTFGSSNAYAVIANTTSSSANIIIEVFDQNGTLKRTQAMTVGPKGVARTWEYLGSIQAIADPALIRITSDQDVVIEAVKWEQNRRGWGFAILPVQ